METCDRQKVLISDKIEDLFKAEEEYVKKTFGRFITVFQTDPAFALRSLLLVVFSAAIWNGVVFALRGWWESVQEAGTDFNGALRIVDNYESWVGINWKTFSGEMPVYDTPNLIYNMEQTVSFKIKKNVYSPGNLASKFLVLMREYLETIR